MLILRRFYDFFNTTDIANSCLEINESEKTTDCEIILSIAPVFESSIPEHIAVDSDVKSKYLQRLNKEIERKDYDEIIFTFSICASIGCFTPTEREEKWNEIDEAYKNLKDDCYIGKARYMQLRKSLKPKELSRLLEHLESSPDLSLRNHELVSPISCWEITERTSSYIIYSMGSEKMKIIIPNGVLTPDARGFLNSMIPVSVATKNNLAYLLRRHELEEIAMRADFSDVISPEQLLEEGIRTFEEFSVINYALSLSGIYADERGNYLIGKDYLTSVKMSLHSEHQHWTSVVDWWSNLALQRNEYEGLVVLTWLFILGLLDVDSISHQSLSILSTKLQIVNSITEDFNIFNKAILDRIE